MSAGSASVPPLLRFEENQKLAEQRLKLLQQVGVVCLLRDRTEQFIHCPGGDPPQFEFGLTTLRRSQPHVDQWQVEILDGAFDHAGSHRPPATELEDRVLPPSSAVSSQAAKLGTYDSPGPLLQMMNSPTEVIRDSKNEESGDIETWRAI